MTNIAHQFEAEVSEAISLIVAATRRATVALLDEALPEQFRRQGMARRVRQRQRGVERPGRARRSVVDIESLTDRLMQTLWASPGQSIVELAVGLGSSSSDLRVPIRRLKDEGRLKTVGVRQSTKYFPVDQPARGDQQSVA